MKHVRLLTSESEHKTVNLGYPNICSISENCNSYTEPKFANVDLDLPSGTKWLKHNIGADSETECGKYFQWGATVGLSTVNYPTDMLHIQPH